MFDFEGFTAMIQVSQKRFGWAPFYRNVTQKLTEESDKFRGKKQRFPTRVSMEVSE